MAARWGSIADCHSTGMVLGELYVGGLVGKNYVGNIADCYVAGTVSGDSCVGGLVGDNTHFSSITDCYVTGSVKGTADDVGGLVGTNSGNIDRCCSTAAISGRESVGGLVGTNFLSITNSYSNGMVLGELEVGGLMGLNYYEESQVGTTEPYHGTIDNCYSTGPVSGNSKVGGLLGDNYSTESFVIVTGCFWDIETSGLTNMCGMERPVAAGCDDSYGKTTAVLQTKSTFLEAGWDFVDETVNGTEGIWWIDEGNDYPRLWWELTE